MVKMIIENKNKLDDIDNISKWLIKTFPKVKGKPLSIEVNSKGKINFIETINLTAVEKAKIQEKFPELKT